MARSFRHTAVPLQSMIERPRLVRVLRDRFDRTVTSVVGGAGFGKSVLLSQAMRDNRAAPRGVDRWLSCEPADGLTTNLLAGLAKAAEVELRDGDDGHDLMVSIAQRHPAGVCFMLDDLHLVPDASAGRRLVTDLVSDPPPGVTFVLASRTPVAGLARLRAQGRTLELTEADLAFRPDELPEVDPATTAQLGGWPALVSLTRSFDLDVAREFVTEELLHGLGPDTIEALAVLSLIGGADRELAGGVLGRPFEPESLLRLPLVHDDGEHVVVHAIWGDLLSDTIDPDRARDVHASVGHELLRRGDVLRAGESFIAADDMDGLRLALRAACNGGITATPVDVLALWWEALDDVTRDSAEGRLLDALLLRSTEPYSDRCLDAVTAAIEAARAAEDVGLEIAGLWEFGFVARGRGEVERILAEVPRVMELEAAGEERAVPLATLARTLIGDAVGQYDEAEQGLLGLDRSGVPSGWQPSIDYLLMTFAYRRGDPGAADAAAASWLEVAPADFPLRELFGPWMDWIHGRTPDWDTLPVPSEVPGSTDADRVWTCPAFGIMYANSCRLAEARRAVDDAHASSAGIVLPSTLAMITGARAALSVAEGDEGTAASMLVATLGTDEAQVGLHERALRQVLAIAYVLHPAMREHWDAVPLGPIHERARQLARSVLAVRSGSKPSLPHADTMAHVGTLLPLGWAVELACATAVDDPLVAREMLERLVDAHGEPTRAALRAAKDSSRPVVAKGASKLLGSVPIGVTGVVLHVLGPTELVVDGTPADGADWRRAKVRALACLMALRRRVRRDEAVDLLWPDLDIDAGRHNLRVTLNYLQRLFEPHRRPGEAPFHLRLEGDWLRLLDPPHVRVDAEEFLEAVERADRLRSEGQLEASASSYQKAVDWWRGECLADVVLEDWSQPSVSRLVSRGAEAAVALASLQLALGEPTEAIDSAYRALQIDRWSEPAHRLVVASHLARGDRPAAQRALDDCLGMLDELGLPPSPETSALGRRLASADTVT